MIEPEYEYSEQPDVIPLYVESPNYYSDDEV